MLQEYNKIIKEQLKLNVVEKVPPSETNNFNQVGNITYLSHRPVIKDDGVTSKVRIVFDASSKIEEPSLNDCLYPEPSINCTITFRYFTFPWKLSIKTLCNFCNGKKKMRLLSKIFHNLKYVIIVFVVYCLGWRHHFSY